MPKACAPRSRSGVPSGPSSPPQNTQFGPVIRPVASSSLAARASFHYAIRQIPNGSPRPPYPLHLVSRTYQSARTSERFPTLDFLTKRPPRTQRRAHSADRCGWPCRCRCPLQQWHLRNHPERTLPSPSDELGTITRHIPGWNGQRRLRTKRGLIWTPRPRSSPSPSPQRSCHGGGGPASPQPSNGHQRLKKSSTPRPVG